MNLKNIRSRILALFFPCRCVLCGDVTAYDDLCCEKCSFRKAGRIDFRDFNPRFLGAVAAAEYTGDIRKAILRIKKNPHDRTLRFFAEQMLGAMRSHWVDVEFDLLVPVPTSASGLKKRGFNQAQKLAEYLSELTNIPICPNILTRRDEARAQHSLNKAERRLNAEMAYEAAAPELAKGKNILLVDDIFTTGATIYACSKKLISAGALSVYAVTAAKTSLSKAKPEENHLR